MHTCVEVRRGVQMSSSITLFCIPLRQVLSQNLETIFLFLAGSQQGPAKNLAPPHNAEAPETGKKISTRALMVVWQTFLATESYFQSIPASLEWCLYWGRRGKIPSHYTGKPIFLSKNSLGQKGMGWYISGPEWKSMPTLLTLSRKVISQNKINNKGIPRWEKTKATLAH